MQDKKGSVGQSIDHGHIKNAVEELRKKFLCLEDKVSQLFFLMTEASYDSRLLADIELLLGVWSCGGVIFLGGQASRQYFLMQDLQEISQTRLLFGNDLQHGLSFLVKEKNMLLQSSQTDWLSIGQELSKSNLRNKIWIQLNFNLGLDIEFFYEKKQHKDSFFSGLRQENFGVFGSLLDSFEEHEAVSPLSCMCSLEYLKHNLYHRQYKQLRNYETLSFVNLSLCPDISESFFRTFFKSGGESFLFSSKEEIDFSVKIICELVRSGKISPLLFENILEKILTLKVNSEYLIHT